MSVHLPRVLVPHPHVRVDAQVMGGSPHVVGLRVPVRRLWAWHRGGSAVETLFRRYPNLGRAKVLDALAFAYDNLELIQADLDREEKLLAERGQTDPLARPLAQMALPFAAPPISPSAPTAAQPGKPRRSAR